VLIEVSDLTPQQKELLLIKILKGLIKKNVKINLIHGVNLLGTDVNFENEAERR